jgi:hypothetical protein
MYRERCINTCKLKDFMSNITSVNVEITKLTFKPQKTNTLTIMTVETKSMLT